MARRALEIDPSEAKACNVLGNILNWRGHHDDSVPYIESAIKLNPSFAAASTARAYHSVMTGAFENAKADMQNAIRLRVGDSGLGLCLPAKALAELHLGEHEKSLETAYLAMRLRPNFWLVPSTLAACLLANGKEATARDIIQQLRLAYDRISGDEFAGWLSSTSPSSSTARQR